MILRNFISLRAFHVYMENSLRFEFHSARSHVNADNEVTPHQSETLSRSEIPNRFEFTSGLM